ncbi:MAG: hypothetical protein CVU77_07790 [Elusimicrobia bacterium HGW-Elusimicrobia-1]|jgi:hypothetical protein|nr:MAG: hypothetical protein CVU77_07790 [Elusimicrobia bacterium HGW-Elusimicrobia-1]
MKCYVDRIEDGKYAVINVTGGGEMIIPVKQFKFKIREGMHLDADFRCDKKSERATLDRVKKLQAELLARSGKKNK